MTAGDRDKWNGIYRDAPAGVPGPARVLGENTHLLPEQGTALDLACGRGGNALLLAGAGLEVHAWDISAVALEQLAGTARRLNRVIHTRVRDVSAEPPAPDSFDVIVVSRFLDRAIAPALAAALRVGGLLFYQTFTVDKDPETGPHNPAYLLGQGELLTLFAGLRPVVYREEGNGEAMLVARKSSEQQVVNSE
jgi:tellurite methyltransferase